MRIVLFLLFIAVWSAPLEAQHSDGRSEDRDAVRAAVVDYVLGIYESAPDRVARSVHPQLAKVGFYPSGEAGELTADTMSYEELLETARTYRRDRDLFVSTW